MNFLKHIDLSTLLTFTKELKIFFVIFLSKKYFFTRRIFGKCRESIVFNKRTLILYIWHLCIIFEEKGGNQAKNLDAKITIIFFMSLS